MKTTLEIIAACLSVSIALIVLMQARAPWAVIGAYWTVVATRNIMAAWGKKE